jgi:hyperosmotically inducible protein
MKKSFTFIISAAAASFLVSTSFAQETTNRAGASAAPSLTATTNSGSADAGQAATNAVPDANNSARNVRDRHDQTLTPGDQGNNSADLATTRAIRKEISSTKDMSVNARNVKIITANGQVTLRGPVKTEDEKRLIGEIASKVAQATNVNNQLEVKLVPTGPN